jgi:hypothetical protein
MVGMIDVDRTSWRNLHLMRRATYHRAKGDEVLFPYDGAAKVDKVILSSVFTRNKPLVGRWLRQLTGRDWDMSLDGWQIDMKLPDWIEVGGTGWNIHRKAPPEIEVVRPDYTLYDGLLGPADYGQGFTSRGCPRDCHFCVVPIMSGSQVKEVATLAEIRNGESKKIKLMDDNFWANSPTNPWRERMIEAIDGGYDISFTQGLDIRFVNEERAELLKRVRFWTEGFTSRMVTFAFDSPKIEKQYRRGFELLVKAGIRPYQIASFVLMGFESTPEEDDRRIAVLRELGAYPYAMVYEPIHGETVPQFYREHPEVLARYGEHLPIEERYKRHWKRCKHIQRWCNKRQLWATVPDFEQYDYWIKEQSRWRDQDKQPTFFLGGDADD